MNNAVITYATYLIVSIGLTIWVAKTLFKNGKIFLDEIFKGNHAFAESVNNLLLVGFYLVNIGYAVYTLKVTDTLATSREIIEVLSIKLGLIILILGGMHFFNLYVLFKLRRKANEAKLNKLPDGLLKL